MEKVITENCKIPIKVWATDLEDGALEQAKNLANLPFAFKHVAIMADSHQGYGMPIGGVLATKGAIIPNAVGVDIGCGVCAVKTSLTDISQEQIKQLFGGSKEYKGGIKTKIPVGFNKHSKKHDEKLMPDTERQLLYVCYVKKNWDNALKSLGTLGGGNHFIEIQKGSDGHIWVMIHSGSRGLGYAVANHYNNVAKELNKKWHTQVNQKHDLAFFPYGSEDSMAYFTEMNFCIEYAKTNRGLMMGVVLAELSFMFPEKDIMAEPLIDLSHNYVAMEHHYGENVMVHRKGATRARLGEFGLIPGSQGTNSYIVKGKGNKESFESCSHGAGRKMSRSKARENLVLEDEIKKLNDKGVIHAIRNKSDLDEAPSSYKDIKTVMENQTDLVDIVVELTPLGVMKG